MIKIKINETDKTDSIEISGHSGYSEAGSDIVCASVSCISITTVNGILSIEDSIKYKESSGYLFITIIKHTNITDKLINNMINLLEQLKEDYKDYIEIRRCHK